MSSRARRVAGVLLGLVLALALALFMLCRVPDRSVADLQEKWASPPSQFVPIAGMSIHLRDEGPRDDPVPILLLHGTSASLHTWEGWTPILNERRRTISFDLPGFGLTGPAPDGDYTIERYVRTVVEVADALGIQRFVIVGNSLGGYVAWATAVLHPDRVDRLVLIDAAGYPYRSKSVPLAFRIARTPVLSAVLKDFLPRAMVESSVRNVYGDPSVVTPQLVDRYLELATREGNRAALIARFEQTRPGPLSNRIPQLKLPTLVLWGGRDRLIPVPYGEKFAREIEGSRLIVFDGLGHVPHEENPAATVAAVVEFLGAGPTVTSKVP